MVALPSVHPTSAGFQLVVSFEDMVRVYHVMDKELRLVFEVPLKGVLRVPNTKTFFSITRVNLVSFSHGGSLLAVVTGKIIQLFSFYSALHGAPAREQILAGHAEDVNALVREAGGYCAVTGSGRVILRVRSV
jgi:hypothetical protein